MRRGTSLLIAACTLALAACSGGDGGGGASATPRIADAADAAGGGAAPPDGTDPPNGAGVVATTASTVAARPTSTSASTIATSSTTVGLTTVETLAPTTTIALPVPAAPPPPRAEEPYVELGTIEIPKIGITEPLLEGITLNTLDRAPGHWPGTAMPGQLGNAVIAGHRTSHRKPFRDIDRLEVGDEVILTTGDGRFVYAVTGTIVVQPDAMHIIEQTAAHTATLFACHPPGSTRQRIVVSLALVP